MISFFLFFQLSLFLFFQFPLLLFFIYNQPIMSDAKSPNLPTAVDPPADSNLDTTGNSPLNRLDFVRLHVKRNESREWNTVLVLIQYIVDTNKHRAVMRRSDEDDTLAFVTKFKKEFDDTIHAKRLRWIKEGHEMFDALMSCNES